ncbi:MAG: hypothetical protein JW760_02385 [Spirochaetales bacterium]|nr:hypothetical protein [Spirochaetales bacterium]
MSNGSSFEELRIVDNFYQTSSYFPMPVVLIGTLSESGMTNLGPYSLCFPYHIAGKDYYTMLLLARNSSNTAKNILRTGKASLNFIPDKRRYMKACVALGYPGDTTEEKMRNCGFTLKEGPAAGSPGEVCPKIVEESYQVFECTWLRNLDGAGNDLIQDAYTGPYHDFNGITSEFGAHFILRIDRILMKPRQRTAIIGSVKRRFYPRVPVDYGYRDNTNFWIASFRRPYTLPIAKGKGTEVSTVYYAANRMDPEVRFTEEACAKLVNVPRVFLNTALKGCVQWAREQGVTTITETEMDIIRDKRVTEKN